MPGDLADKEQAYSAAARRFPQAEFAIRSLLGRNEAFREICEELAAAERALALISGPTAKLREARRIEWQVLIDRLVTGVGTVLWENQAELGRKK